MKPILIVAHPGDRLALRVCAELQQRATRLSHLPGASDVKLVSAQEIALSTGWEHRQTSGRSSGRTSTQIRLADGFVLADQFGAVFNRLQQIELPHFAGATSADRDYAQAEMQALLLSWLSGLSCPVINPASPQGLGGVRRTHAQWMHLAQQAGLPIQAYHFTTNPRQFSPHAQANSRLLPYRAPASAPADEFSQLTQMTWPQVGRDPTFFLQAVTEERRTLLVAGEQVVGMIDSVDGKSGVDMGAIRQLAQLAHCPLLQIVFGLQAGPKDPAWTICAITPFPLTEDEAAIGAIANLLEEAAKQ